MFGGGKVMTVSIIFSTIFEAALVGFGLWALFNEDKFISFEEKLLCLIKRRRLTVREVRRDITPTKVIRITEFD
jgi:hypothetical protein